MAMARHWGLRGARSRWTLCGASFSVSKSQIGTDRAFCSVEEAGNSQPLTLAILGFEDDGQDVELELSRTPVTETGRRPKRPASTKSSRIPSTAACAPSAEEMKRAALDASYILAGVAGMRLRSPKDFAAIEAATGSVRKVRGQQQQTQDDGAIGAREEVEGSVAGEEVEDQVDQDSSLRLEMTTFVADEATEPDHQLTLNHPWPEWLEFLMDLQTKGFFNGSEQGVEGGKHLFESFATVRHATNGFGRSHSEIFNCLSRKDLRVLAEFGCPDVERKASNASKRLRAHFRIPEGDVCQRCRLKMTCPRAYFASESNVRMNTLDVVRIITGFAMNVWPNADNYTAYPMEVGTSVCSLLKEFLRYKVLPNDPAKDEHVPNERSPLEPEKKLKKRMNGSPLLDPKPGDWACPNCEFLNFGRNRRCRECRVCRPQQEKNAYVGDWHCPKCRYLNFSKNHYCRECKLERPTNVMWMGGERLPDVCPASEKLRSKERTYEASDHEDEASDISLMNPDELTEPESDGSLSEEEEKALSKGLSNVARRLTRATFKWDDPNKVEKDFFGARVASKESTMSSCLLTGRSSRRK